MAWTYHVMKLRHTMQLSGAVGILSDDLSLSPHPVPTLTDLLHAESRGLHGRKRPRQMQVQVVQPLAELDDVSPQARHQFTVTDSLQKLDKESPIGLCVGDGKEQGA